MAPVRIIMPSSVRESFLKTPTHCSLRSPAHHDCQFELELPSRIFAAGSDVRATFTLLEGLSNHLYYIKAFLVSYTTCTRKSGKKLLDVKPLDDLITRPGQVVIGKRIKLVLNADADMAQQSIESDYISSKTTFLLQLFVHGQSQPVSSAQKRIIIIPRIEDSVSSNSCKFDTSLPRETKKPLVGSQIVIPIRRASLHSGPGSAVPPLTPTLSDYSSRLSTKSSTSSMSSAADECIELSAPLNYQAMVRAHKTHVLISRFQDFIAHLIYQLQEKHHSKVCLTS